MTKKEEKLTARPDYDWIGLTFRQSRPRRSSADAGLCNFSSNLAPGSELFFDPGAKHPSNPRYDWGENGVSCGVPDPMKGIETWDILLCPVQHPLTCGVPDPMKGIET